jgi:hypothetical protein
MQQAGAVELVQGGKQLAQGQVAIGAEQGEGAGFNRVNGHFIYSFVKHWHMNTPAKVIHQDKM